MTKHTDRSELLGRKRKKKFDWADFMSNAWTKWRKNQKKLIERKKEWDKEEHEAYVETMKAGAKEIGKKKAEKKIEEEVKKLDGGGGFGF